MRIRIRDWFLLLALLAIAIKTTAGAMEIEPEMNIYANQMLTSLTAQTTFARSIPSIVDYSQTAHSVADAGRILQTNALASLYPSYCAPGKNWVMWDTPFLVNETQKRDGDNLGYDNHVSGFATGISRMLGETSAIGLAVGYDYRKLSGRDNQHWRGRADAFHAALYGGTAIGCFFLDIYAGYSRDRQRSEALDADGDQYNANFSNTVLSSGLKASYVWILPSEFRITPAVGLEYSQVRMGSFTERGLDPWNRRLNSTTFNSFTLPITMSFNRTFATDFLSFGNHQALWTPEARAGWIPRFGAKNAGGDGVYVNTGNPVGIRSAKLPRSYGTAGAGLKIKLNDKFVFSVDYDYSWAAKYRNHTLTGTYGLCF